MKYVAKYLFYQVICPLLLFFGFDKLLRGLSSKRRLIVMYHGVSNKKNFSINGRHLPSDEFEKHLRYLKRHFNILSLTEICNLNQDSQSRHSVALTFDDGYLNNVQNAIPLLLKYEIPATFFISTISLTDQEYIHPSDYIDVISKSTSESFNINEIRFQRKNGQPLTNSGTDAYGYITSLNFQKFNHTLSNLKQNYPIKNILKDIDPELYSLITSETIAKVVKEKLFTAGSHSHVHVNLNMLSKDELDHQLATSKRILEFNTQTVIDSIAFPYGYFNEDVVERSLQNGFQYLFAGGSISEKWHGRVFPRIGILNKAGYAFNMLSINRGFRNFGF